MTIPVKMHALALVTAASAALLAVGTASAGAQGVPAGGYRSPPPRVHGGGGFHNFPGFFWPYEREVVYVEREVIHEVAVAPAAAPAPPPPPRKPYVIGRTYDMLPGPCMKMIADGAVYFQCSGEWYRQVGNQYRAVAQP